MSARPRATVFMPVHNRARLIGRAVTSVLRQSFGDFELLLIDDGSSDDSVRVIRRFSDPRIRLLQNGENLGIARTRQRGLEEARGTFIALLDSDDAMPPRRLEQQVRFLHAHPHVATVGGWAREFDAAGKLRRSVKVLPLVPGELKARLLFRTCFHNSSTMSRLSVLREFGYDPAFPVSSDYEMFSRVAHDWKLANLPRVFLHRGVHEGRVTVERAAEVRRMNMTIAARQLQALGLPTDQATVEHHVLVARLKKQGIHPDEAFLDRTAAWFERIEEANREAGVYEPAALSATLAQLWAIACLRARRRIGRHALSYFWSSRLRSSVASGLRANIAAALAGQR